MQITYFKYAAVLSKHFQSKRKDWGIERMDETWQTGKLPSGCCTGEHVLLYKVKWLLVLKGAETYCSGTRLCHKGGSRLRSGPKAEENYKREKDCISETA